MINITVTYQDYINTAKSAVAQRILKIEVLDSITENVVNTITPSIIGGNLTLSSDSGSRRSCNIIFDNSNGNFIPDPDGQFWINTKYKLSTGYYVNGYEYYFQQGIFVSGEPEVSSLFSDQQTNLQLYDKWTLLDGTLAGTLESPYKIIAGTDLEEAVRQVFLAAGEIRPVIIEPLNGLTTPFTIFIDAGQTYSDILMKLADMVSYVVYYSNDGFPRFEPPTDIDSSGVVFPFTINEGIYLGSRKRYEYSKVKNICLVIGANVLGSIIRGRAEDTNIDSPTTVSKIGKRVLVINDDNISTVNLANTRAEFELLKAIQVIESISAECVPFDSIKGDDVISVYDTNNGTNKRYLVKSLSMPLLNDGNMQLQLCNARSLLSYQ